MGYLDQLLGDGEQIIFETRQHPFVFYGRIAFEVAVIVMMVAAAYVTKQASDGPGTSKWDSYGSWVMAVLIGLSVLVIVSAVIDYLRWVNERYILTDRRVIHLRGIANKSTVDSSLEKINDVQTSQTVFGRMFNYGDVEILTASDEGINRMIKIANPLEFKRSMLNAKNNLDSYMRPPSAALYEAARNDHRAYAPAPSENDFEALLSRLADLRQKGLITEDEFQQKRREILSRI